MAVSPRPHRYRLLFLLTALHLTTLVSCSCISTTEQKRHVNADFGRSYYNRAAINMVMDSYLRYGVT